jgi:DNA-binding response OmpR family regulator
MRKKILIIEDNTQLLELTRLNLKAEGFSVVTATNGLEAIDKARSAAPDLILLDLALPEMDGFAVCESLRKDAATSEIPILILTGFAGELTRLASLDSGASDYLTKPADPKELLRKIKELLHAQPRSRPAIVALARNLR